MLDIRIFNYVRYKNSSTMLDIRIVNYVRYKNSQLC